MTVPESTERCFACGKALKPGKYKRVQVLDEDQQPFVGPECYRKIVRAGKAGYQPPQGGPKLCLMEEL